MPVVWKIVPSNKEIAILFGEILFQEYILILNLWYLYLLHNPINEPMSGDANDSVGFEYEVTKESCKDGTPLAVYPFRE